jgi:hypothetical protein
VDFEHGGRSLELPMSSLDDRRRDLFTWLIVGVLLLAELSVGYLLCYYLLPGIVSL